jgi:hypothetical protein
MIPYTVYISNLDFTDYILEKPVLALRKNDVGNLIEIPNVDLVLDNSEDLFTPEHPNCIFTGAWDDRVVTLYEDSLRLYSGYVREFTVTERGQQANLTLTATINRKVGAAMLPTYADQSTPAEHSRAVYQQFGIETDLRTYEYAIARQIEMELVCRICHTLEHNQTLMEFQQFLANLRICPHYFYDNHTYIPF